MKRRRDSAHKIDAQASKARHSHDQSSRELEGSGASNSLCTRCASIDRDNNLYKILNQTGQDRLVGCIGQLGPPTTSWCRLCRLFASVLFTRTEDRGNPLPQCYLHSYPIKDSEIWGAYGNVLLLLTGDPESAGFAYIEDITEALSSKGGLAPISCNSWFTNPGNLLSVPVLAVQSQTINFAQLRSWIDSCTDSHKTCQTYAKETPRPSKLKLIDCESRSIVQDESLEYVALSYVWGLSSTRGEESQTDPLASTLLPTIEDAIVATRNLGYRYLWIDRYCINQTNESDKRLQIAQMTLIYRHAEVTIVAAAGDGPHLGLPGVGIRPRTPRPSTKISGYDYVATLDDLNRVVERSKWYTRGWTYQEGYFSRRRLYFLDSRVFFTCHEGSASEDICHLRPDRSSYATEVTKKIEHYAFEVLGHLSQYSGKELTYPSDAIDAVAGVFKDHILRDGGATAHYLGIPIIQRAFWGGNDPKMVMRRATDAFLIGLSWFNRKPGERRGIWPSWSWAEWNVKFHYGLMADDEVDKPVRVETFAKQISWHPPPEVFIERSNGPRVDLNRSDATQRIADELGLTSFINIYSWTCTLDVRAIGDTEWAVFEKHPFKSLYMSAKQTQSSPTRFYGTFGDKTVNIKLYLWPLYPSSRQATKNDIPDRFAPNLSTTNNDLPEQVVAIVTSRQWLGDGNWTLHMMLLQQTGSYHERVGHCCLSSVELRELGLQRQWINEKEWPEQNQHTVRMPAIMSVMNKLMDWKTVRVG